MRPVCLLVRTKNLRQSDGLHFISDSLKMGLLHILFVQQPHFQLL